MLHTIKNEFLTVTAKEAGAELMSILGADGTEYLWQGDAKYWSDRALNIFPYVARLNDKKYYMDGELHEMAIHGIAPYRDFTVTENDGVRMVFQLKADGKTMAEYPRSFVFRIIYALEGKTLKVTYECENQDGKTMYFGLGGHPGFNVPLAPGKAFEDYRLRFAEVCEPYRVGFNADCFVTHEDTPFELEEGTILNLRHDLFDDDAIVLRDMAREVTLESDGGHSVTVSFPGMQYLGLWHWPKTDAPYICIEPWCSLPADAGRITVFEEQSDLISLEPGKTYINDWSISIS
ncbi:MAG: aldose 1-epimerase family protein [Ruminococcaceae bacterium]|nr:aldose 1-epimerase family protein [Oscillospiraceae bacterium]